MSIAVRSQPALGGGIFGGILSWEMKNAPAMSSTETAGRSVLP